MSLEFMKVTIRSALAGLVGSNRKLLRDEIVELENLLNEMQALRVKAVAVETRNDRINKVDIIDNAIIRTKNDLAIMRETQSKESSFKARAKWFDKGEKSN